MSRHGRGALGGKPPRMPGAAPAAPWVALVPAGLTRPAAPRGRSLSWRAREGGAGSARWRPGRYHGVERAGPALPYPRGVQKGEPDGLASRGQPSDSGRRARLSHAAPLRGGGAQPAVWPPSAPSPPPQARVDRPIARVAQGRRENANPSVGR